MIHIHKYGAVWAALWSVAALVVYLVPVVERSLNG